MKLGIATVGRCYYRAYCQFFWECSDMMALIVQGFVYA